MSSFFSGAWPAVRKGTVSIVAVIGPIFVSVVLCGGLIEKFKDDTAFRKDIVATYFRPMMSDQNECFQMHRTYIDKVSDVAGGYRLALNELKELFVGSHHETPQYGALLKAILENNQTVGNDAQEFRKKTIECEAKLLQRYQEMALVTGTYSRYSAQLKQRNQRMGEIAQDGEKKKKEIVGDSPKYTPESIMNQLRELLQVRYETREEKAAVYKKIEAMGEPLIALQSAIANEEIKALEADQVFANQLNDLYSEEINTRFSRSFGSRLIFW